MLFKRRKKINYLKQIYKVTDTNSFIIEVSLENYNELFNGWDPSPIKRRDLEPDLLHFIEQCAFDIPMKYDLELHLYLPKAQQDQQKETLTEIGIRNNFKFIIHFIKRELRNNHRKMIVYMIMSFSFLILAYLSRQRMALGLLSTTLVEGMFIGGWVFLWEAFSLFFFSSQETNARLKRYNRFLQSPIIFNYE